MLLVQVPPTKKRQNSLLWTTCCMSGTVHLILKIIQWSEYSFTDITGEKWNHKVAQGHIISKELNHFRWISFFSSIKPWCTSCWQHNTVEADLWIRQIWTYHTVATRLWAGHCWVLVFSTEKENIKKHADFVCLASFFLLQATALFPEGTAPPHFPHGSTGAANKHLRPSLWSRWSGPANSLSVPSTQWLARVVEMWPETCDHIEEHEVTHGY